MLGEVFEGPSAQRRGSKTTVDLHVMRVPVAQLRGCSWEFGIACQERFSQRLRGTPNPHSRNS